MLPTCFPHSPPRSPTHVLLFSDLVTYWGEAISNLKGAASKKAMGYRKKSRDWKSLYLQALYGCFVNIHATEVRFSFEFEQLSVRRSNAGSTFTNDEQKLREMLAREASIHFFYARGRLCRWRHIRRIPDTKWQRSRLSWQFSNLDFSPPRPLIDWQPFVSIFVFYSCPFDRVRTASSFRVPIKWILENTPPLFGSCHL